MALVLQYLARYFASDLFILFFKRPDTNLLWTFPKLPIIKTTISVLYPNAFISWLRGKYLSNLDWNALIKMPHMENTIFLDVCGYRTDTKQIYIK